MAIPARVDLTRSRKNLKEVYADQLKDRSLAARRALAKKLLDDSDKADNTPADRFALLGGALESAKEGESLRLCLDAAQKMAEAFDVDGLKLKVEAATSMNLKSSGQEDNSENFRAGLDLVDALANAEEFQEALRMLTAIRPLGGANVESRKLVLQRAQFLESAWLAFERIQPSLEKLKTTPDDPAANLAVGNYYCLRVGAWEKGLPFLAKSADARLKELARQELAAPTESAGQLKLADAWWELAEDKGTNEIDARPMKVHAATWYRAGQSGAIGLEGRVVQVRLEQAATFAPAAPKQSAESPPAPLSTSSGTGGVAAPAGTVDLLRLTTPRRDAIDGDWRLTDAGLAFESKDGSRGQIRIPFDPPPEYDWIIDLTSPPAELNIMAVHNGERYIIRIGGAGNHNCRIFGDADPNQMRSRLDSCFNGQRSNIVVGFRNERLEVSLNGKVVTSCAISPGHGDGGHGWWVGEHVLGLGPTRSMVFHSIRLVQIGQSGKMMPRAPLDYSALPGARPIAGIGRVVNLMPLIDPSRDANEGTWKRTAGGLESSPHRCRLRIPYQPPEEYDFTMKYRRPEGNAGIVQNVSVGGKNVAWMVGVGDNAFSGFELVKGAWIFSNPTTLAFPECIKNNRLYTSTVHVRRGRIAASMDGKLVADYSTDGKDLDIRPFWRTGDACLGIASDGRVLFESIEIREIIGHGTVVPHPEIPSLGKAPPHDPAERVVNLLPMIDGKRDAIEGTWRSENGGLLGDGGKLRIPYHPPQEYDFHLRLRRVRGEYLQFMLSHGERNFSWLAGGWYNRVIGFHLVDGRAADSNSTRVTTDLVFEDGREYDVVLYVRGDYVAASVDGKLVSELKTDFKNLSQDANEYIGDGVLGLRTNSVVQYDLIELREVTGSGRPAPRGE